MDQDIERELKVMLSKAQYDKLKSILPSGIEIRQKNTYYDSEDGQLKKNGCALRIRRTSSGNILTIKKPADEISKKEYEIPIEADSLSELSSSQWAWIQHHLDLQKPLRQIASFSTCRTIIETPAAQIDLDETDFGSVKDYELEYEYHIDHDGISALNQILNPLGIKFEKNGPSKIARALSVQSTNR